MDLGLSGKSVIVTGGASNIGRAITLAFAAEGAKITIAELDVALAEKVAEEAKAKGAGGVQVVPTDVTKLDQVEAMVQQAVKAHGTVDIHVNNVGWDRPMFFTKTTPDFWDRIIQINYLGLINCTKAVLDVMLPNNKGAIVAISSDASRQGEPREAVYGGAKAAVNSFMKTIARENGRYGIRCNCVCPGVTIPDETEARSENSMWADVDSMFTPEQQAKAAAALPLKRIGRPADIAPAVLFLASDVTASMITGQVLSVSGGYTMIG
jgi:NAD(P)-dependent dehydrogenase (short-subunit alcohol dehydrogenase family)